MFINFNGFKVNGCDVLGQKIFEVAEKIRHNWNSNESNCNKNNSDEFGVTFLLWNSKSDQNVSNIMNIS